MKKGFFLVNKGEAFEAQGLGQFAKEIVRVGKWIHPVTGKDVVFDAARIERLAKNTEAYLKHGNTIPFPNGHTTDALANLGHWPGPFIKLDDKLIGVVEPKVKEALEGIRSGSLDHVSAYIEPNVTDSKGNVYDEVITHVCATNYPVITGQKDFVALATKDIERLEAGIFLPEALDGDTSEKPAACDETKLNPFDMQKTHAALMKGMKDAHKDYTDAYAKKGKGHDDTKAAAQKFQDASTKVANHAALMNRAVQNVMSPYAYNMGLAAAKKPSVGEALEALAKSVHVDPLDTAIALETALDPQFLAKVSAATNSAGKFKSGFDGCVLHMKNKGYSEKSAKAICGKIAQNAK